MAAVTPARRFSSAEVVRAENYTSFLDRFRQQILSHKFDEADDLLELSKPFYRELILSEMPFGQQIESLLDGSTGSYHRVIQMAKILERHELASNTVRVFHLGALIASGFEGDASDYLRANGDLTEFATDLLVAYKREEESNRLKSSLMERIIGFKPKDPTVLDLRLAAQQV